MPDTIGGGAEDDGADEPEQAAIRHVLTKTNRERTLGIGQI
jgi:hypothetical protein